MGSNAEESELDRYEDRAYRQLKEKIYKTYYGGGTFRCPFCTENRKHAKQVYLYDDLVEHARNRGSGLINMDLKKQGQHLALTSYLTKYHGPRLPESPSNKGDLHGQCGRDDATSTRVLHASVKKIKNSSDTQKSSGVQDMDIEQNKSKTSSRVSQSYEIEMHVTSDNSSKTLRSIGEQDRHVTKNNSKKFVHPWKGLLVNVPVEFKDGRYVGESGTKLKEKLAKQGLNPEKVTPLWNYNGFSGWCMVDFIGDLTTAYENAMRFEKAFEVDHHGKTDWYKANEKSRGDKLYGWVATEEDYQSNSLLRKYLKKCNLKSIEDIEAEEKTKDSKLVLQLTSSIQNKDLESKKMKNQLQATSVAINLVMDETEAMTEAHIKALNDMHRSEQKRTGKMLAEHEGIKRKIESQKNQLLLREKELDRREVRNENEKRELLNQQRSNELAEEVQKQAHENLMRLAEEQRKKKEALHKKSIELGKELAHKQALELEVERMRGAVKIMGHMGDDENVAVKKEKQALAEELEEKIEELDLLEDLNQALIIKEKKASEELQEARKALINGLQSGSSKGARPTIGVKYVGELQGKPFQIAAKKRYPADMVDEKARKLFSKWDTCMKDASWRPFKLISEKGGATKEVINEEDESLNELRNEVGEEGYNAVVTALIELKDYCCPEDQTPRLDLWNFKEHRPSTLYEGVVFLINKWKQARKKK